MVCFIGKNKEIADEASKEILTMMGELTNTFNRRTEKEIEKLLNVTRARIA